MSCIIVIEIMQADILAGPDERLISAVYTAFRAPTSLVAVCIGCLTICELTAYTIERAPIWAAILSRYHVAVRIDFLYECKQNCT